MGARPEQQASQPQFRLLANMITSVHNPKIKWVRALQEGSRARREARAFVVEGIRLVEEALDSGWEAQLVLWSAGLPPRGQALVERFIRAGAPVLEVAGHVLRAASDTQTPQGILAVLPMLKPPQKKKVDFILIADGVRDPGNLGAMLRTAAAAGVDEVWLPTGTVDPFAPKVVRAAMGAHFRLPVHAGDWEQIQADTQERGLHVYLAAAGRGTAYTQADFRRPLALIVGGEASGAGNRAQKLADGYVHIPMPGEIESLNAAIAAAILLFEIVRQRSP